MTRVDGLISGINTSEIIEGLLQFQRQPITRLQGEIEQATQRKAAVTTLSARLLSVQLKVRSLTLGSTFNAVNVRSSNENQLLAQGSSDLAPGSYRFRVKQLAQSEQYTASGVSAIDDAVGAGTISVETGNGAVERKTELDILNGGDGVRRGAIRITNRAGTTGVIDLSTAVTVDDVIEEINNAGLNVAARVARSATAGSGGSDDTNIGEAIVLVDGSGGSGNFIVEEVSGGETAGDLGILTAVGGVASTEVQGSSIVGLSGRLKLSALNDGLGVRVGSGNTIGITTRDGSSYEVDIDQAKTIQDVIDEVASQTSNDVTLSISGGKLVATDSTSGGGTFAITDINSSSAATDLGLTNTASAGTITGDRVLAKLNSVLLKTLNGTTASFPSGNLSITNRSGTNFTVDLSSAESLADVIDEINSTATGVTASYNRIGNGLLLRDTTGSTSSNLIVAESGGTAASSLGILQSVADDTLTGTDLDPQYIGENTLLSTLNGGQGVFSGTIRISDSSGSFTVDLGQETTIGDVLSDINGQAGARGSTVTASINSSGNGLLIQDSGGGSVKVEEVSGGTTAADLNILGSDSGGSIDGAFEKTITVSATDTLEDVVEAINDLSIGVTASISNDGSALNPFRLQIAGQESGSLARVLVDSTGSGLSFSRTSQARDAVLFAGSTEGGSQPVVARSRDNRFEDVVNGLTVTALEASGSEISVTANRDPERIKTILGEIAEGYNDVVADIQELTRIDPTAGTRGILVGDTVLRRIERSISDAFSSRVLGLPSGQNLASNFGLRFQSNGTLRFDANEFDEVLANDPDAAERLFTQRRDLETSTLLADFDNGAGLTTNAGADLEVTLRDGTKVEVDVGGDRTVADLIQTFNAAGFNSGTSQQDFELSISSDARSLVLTDNTSGSSTFKVSAVAGSDVFKLLGLNKSADTEGGGKITGTDINLADDPGLALTLEEIFKGFLDVDEGDLTLRADLFQDEIDSIEEEIDRREEILLIRETTLRQEFAQLEVLLGRNQNEQQRLSAALNGIPRG